MVTDTWKLAITTLIVAFAMLGMVVLGATLERGQWEQKLRKAGAVYYHAETGELTLKGCE